MPTVALVGLGIPGISDKGVAQSPSMEALEPSPQYAYSMSTAALEPSTGVRICVCVCVCVCVVARARLHR